MNASFLVLGVLHRGDFHPYEIKRRLERAMVGCYIDVDVGTLYYGVRQLQKEHLIEAVSEERVSRGGVRTIYRITDNGKSEFRDRLHEQFSKEGPVSQTLYGALLFIHLADQQILEQKLRERISSFDELIEKLGPIGDQRAPSLGTGGKYLLRHIEDQRRLDREFLTALLSEIEHRGIKDVFDPSMLGTD
jgi:DNA-binding PadR family transcriptional regulator